MGCVKPFQARFNLLVFAPMKQYYIDNMPLSPEDLQRFKKEHPEPLNKLCSRYVVWADLKRYKEEWAYFWEGDYLKKIGVSYY
jgi:hypothetical protein